MFNIKKKNRSIALINDTKSFNGPPSSYSIERNEFLKWLELAESTRTKLYKSQVVLTKKFINSNKLN